ncbi:hypothetical protein GAYE_SCF20G4035 [Galdieria yellowstonensis]|jgi:aprataxin|uniref:HIT domain-containing protein n=1 Tax=Galdieria yellowstonensis TaxID=3028027 RepID=A0AAV9IFA7_9RHOD|nr:hypothetical protein GAYE_SCF20G4035 [Galdieria yellowstonensis]
MQTFPPYESSVKPVQRGDLNVLRAIASNPSSFPEIVYFADDQVVTIYDAFPKSRFHLLLLPRQYIPEVSWLAPCHVGLLQHMIKVGTEIATFLTQQYLKSKEEQTFMLGFHAIPSLDQLHMHIISTDFVSPFLKTRKHWNSFHTDFFLPASYVLEELKAGRRLVPAKDREKYVNLLKRPLLCHRCKESFQNMKALKQHVSECRQLFVAKQADASQGIIDKYFIKLN